MKDFLLALLHAAVITARVCGPGGVRAVIAENLLLKQQLIVLRRARPAGAEPDAERPAALRIRVALPQSRTNPKGRHRPAPLDAPGVSSGARCVAEYRRLFSSSQCPKKPGPKGPSEALIQAIVELKSRNPRFGCPRIARTISHTFGVEIDKNVVYRVLSKHYRPAPGGTGPSWLSCLGHTTDSLWSVDLFRCESIVLRSYWVLVVMDQFTRRLVGVGVHRGPVDSADLCRMFNAVIHGRGTPRRLSTRIMIRSSRRTVGRRTFGFWTSAKSRLYVTCPCHTHS